MKVIINELNMAQLRRDQMQTQVLKQLGYSSLTDEAKQTLSDIANNGIDGGFGDFIYHADTVKFFNDNKSEILEHCANMAEELGEDMLTMVAGFGCLKDQNLTATDIMSGIHETDSEHETTVKNALAWYIAESVAHEVMN